MESTATFSFYGDLNDFYNVKDHVINYQFHQHPSVKDVIEAIGVPHTEVDVIIVNTAAVNFNYHLKNEDQVEVYPYHSKWPAKYSINGTAPVENGFVADVHAGGLVRQLRMLGFDVMYNNQLSETDITNLGVQHNRIILTRSTPLLKQKQVKWGYWLRSQQTDKQLTEIICRFNLLPIIKPYSRCIACNGNIIKVEKQQIFEQLPQKTREFFNNFWQCNNCKRIYWKGSHYQRMELLIQQLKSKCQ